MGGYGAQRHSGNRRRLSDARVFFVLARIGTYSTPLFAFYIVSIMLGAGLILLGKRMRDGHG